MSQLTPEQQDLAAKHGLSEDELLAVMAEVHRRQQAIAALEGVSFYEAGLLMEDFSRLQIWQLKNQALEWNL